MTAWKGEEGRGGIRALPEGSARASQRGPGNDATPTRSGPASPKQDGGEGGIRTPGPGLSRDNCLAGSPVRPLQHLSVFGWKGLYLITIRRLGQPGLSGVRMGRGFEPCRRRGRGTPVSSPRHPTPGPGLSRDNRPSPKPCLGATPAPLRVG
jgi:hypothetical protein